MAKIAALAPTLLASLGMAAGASLIDSIGQKRFQKDQKAANRSWLDYQNKNKARFEQMEDSERAKAQAAFMENLGQQGQENREGIIGTEADRLNEIYGGGQGLDTTAQDLQGSAPGAGRSEVFDTAMAESIANATAEARKRIQGLAKASAYGGGTQYGQGQTLGKVAQDAGTDIGFANTNRMGNTNTLQRYQSVQPEVLEYKQSPLVPLLKAGSMIVGGMGPGGLGALGGGAGPGMTFGKGLTQANAFGIGAPGALSGRGLSFLPVPWNNNMMQL